jgi:2-hydroxychromene-2-carboxylate isomerase
MPVSVADSVQAAAEFFFDSGCPWSYLALGRLREAAIRTGTRIVYRPVLLAEIGASTHSPVPQDELAAARQRYRQKDLQDWARFCGVSLRDRGGDTVDTTWAQRGVIVVQRRENPAAFVDGLLRTHFAEGRDISQFAAVVALAESVWLDSRAFAAELGSPDTLTEVHENVERLLHHGGFGTPTMLVGTDLYFGNDRMPLVEIALARAGGMRFVMPGEHGP